MTDIPYKKLKEDQRAYTIMLLHEQYNASFSSLSKKYKSSVKDIIHTYNEIKLKQLCFYIIHLSVVLGLESTSEITQIVSQAEEWYKDLTYVVGYMEKSYKDILIEYRKGEPGMAESFLEMIPPIRSELSQNEIEYIITMRMAKKKSFDGIAKELSITPAKAKNIFEIFQMISKE